MALLLYPITFVAMHSAFRIIICKLFMEDSTHCRYLTTYTYLMNKKKAGALYVFATMFGREGTMARRVGFEIGLVLQTAVGMPIE